MVFSADGRVLIKVLRQEKGYGVKNSSQKCPSTERTDPTHVCMCIFRCVDNGVGVGVRRQLQVGQIKTLPYGWSFWLAVVAAIMFLLNGIFMAYVSSAAASKTKLSEVARIRKHQAQSVA